MDATAARERTQAASDALVDYLVANPVWRGEIAHAIHGMPQGLPGVDPARVVRDAVLGLGLMGIPPMVTWARVAKRLLSQLGESGDEYRRRCHVVALEEAPAGAYRAQGDHGQPWQGDWERAEEEQPWWYDATPAMVLQGYSYGPLGAYAFVQRAGRPAVVLPLGLKREPSRPDYWHQAHADQLLDCRDECERAMPGVTEAGREWLRRIVVCLELELDAMFG